METTGANTKSFCGLLMKIYLLVALKQNKQEISHWLLCAAFSGVTDQDKPSKLCRPVNRFLMLNFNIYVYFFTKKTALKLLRCAKHPGSR